MDKYIFYLLALVVFVLPLSANIGSGLFVITFILALIDCATGKKEERPPLPKKLKYSLWALFLLSGLSVFLSKDVFASAYNWVWVVGEEAGMFWLIYRYANKEHRPLFLMKAFLVSAGIVAFYGIIQYCYGIGVQDPEWTDAEAFPELKRRAFSTLENPNILASFLVTAAAYCAGIFAPLRGGKTRIALLSIFTLCVACLLFTFSRGNWLSLFCVLFIFAAFFYHKAFLPFIGGGLAVLYLGWNMLAHRILSIFSTEDTSAALRMAYLESTVDIIKDHPFGVGWYGYRYVYNDYDFYLNDPSVIMYHCHNLFLNYAAELSVVGLALFLYILWQMYHVAVHIKNHAKLKWVKGISCGYLASLVGVIIGGLTDHTLFNIQLGMLFWSANALVLTLLGRLEEEE